MKKEPLPFIQITEDNHIVGKMGQFYATLSGACPEFKAAIVKTFNNYETVLEALKQVYAESDGGWRTEHPTAKLIETILKRNNL